MSIHDDDPLKMLGDMGKEGPEEDAETGDEEGHMAASALIDAIHSKDPKAVLDAFRGMSSLTKPPGEDDLESEPISSGGVMMGEMK